MNVWYDVAKKWAYLVALGMPRWDSQRAAIQAENEGSEFSACRPYKSNISGYTGRIFAIFHDMKELYVQMMDLYLIFQFVKGRFDGNQIILPL